MAGYESAGKVSNMKITLTREQEVLRAVELAKKSQFGATGIKVELEALFDRRNAPLSEEVECNRCDGEGYIPHNCMWGCDECHHTSRLICTKCTFKRKNWRDDRWVQQWILKELYPLGLSVRRRATGYYEPKGPLVFCLLYTDASVDTELTFTISFNKPENIFLVPKVIEVFKRIGDEIGRGINTSNAGMHTSLLQDKNCFYPNTSDLSSKDRKRFGNFEKSMRLLMPALFFLASPNSTSRPLRFREPKVSGDKFSAIHYYGKALEFRVFETCYDNPEQILDNFVVMRNCLRFWSEEYRSPKLEKITKVIGFGNNNDERVDRFFTTVEHLKLLSAGVMKIKPSYKTMKELKIERNFKISRSTINERLAQARRDAEVAYKEYDNRYEWRKQIDRLRIMEDVMAGRTSPTPEQQAEILVEAERLAEEHVTYLSDRKLPVTVYVEEELQKFNKRNAGSFQLCAE